MNDNSNGDVGSSAEGASAPPASETPGFVSRVVYSTCYCLGFGVTWPVLFVARALPANGAIRSGLRDGAHQAELSSDQARARLAHSATAVRQTAENCYTGVAQRVQQRVESVQDAIAERRYRKRLGGATN